MQLACLNVNASIIALTEMYISGAEWTGWHTICTSMYQGGWDTRQVNLAQFFEAASSWPHKHPALSLSSILSLLPCADVLYITGVFEWLLLWSHWIGEWRGVQEVDEGCYEAPEAMSSPLKSRKEVMLWILVLLDVRRGQWLSVK